MKSDAMPRWFKFAVWDKFADGDAKEGEGGEESKI